MKNPHKNKILLIGLAGIIFFLAALVFAAAPEVSAQGADNLLWGNTQDEVQNLTGLGNADPRVMIANVIRIVLAFLGIVAVVLIIYGGWVWMTAGGDAAQVDKAKKILTSAVIGLIIILMAFGIATFVMNRLYEATGGETGEFDPSPWPGPGPGPDPDSVSCDGNAMTPVCDADNSICDDSFGEGVRFCDPDANCTCQPLGGVGDPCDSDESTAECDPADTMCQDGLFCDTESDCTCQGAPIIDWVSPGDGAEGTMVTIGGRHFGDEAGTVYFHNGTGFSVIAPLANTVNSDCGDSWSDNQIIVVVPAGTTEESPIRVERIDGDIDDTNDARGPDVPDFIVNDTTKPGLCLVDPAIGGLGDTLTYRGIRLAGSEAYFGRPEEGQNVPGVNSDFPGDLAGEAQVPNINPGRTTTYAFGSGEASNMLFFRKTGERTGGPQITSFDPVSGNVGQYVTIYGSNLGYARGPQLGNTHNVYFDTDVSDNTAPEHYGTPADFDFPDVCAGNLWQNTQIIVKVPEGLLEGQDYYLVIDTRNWSAPIDSSHIVPSEEVSPTFDFDSNAALTPSLCRIEPTMGPNNSPFRLWGEYFGPRADGEVEFAQNVIMRNFDNISDIDNQSDSGWIQTVSQFDNADYIASSVPQSAVSGPVRVYQDGLSGNSLNFRVGMCTDAPDPDEACGTQICCPNSTFRAGECADTMAECASDNPSSVYEWDFTSGTSTDTGSDSDGICATFTTPDECTENAQEHGCCVDANRGSVCRGGAGSAPGEDNIYGHEMRIDGGDPDYIYCSYYECAESDSSQCSSEETPQSYAIASSSNRLYTATSTCVQSCRGVPQGLGVSCSFFGSSSPELDTCNTNVCDLPFSCMQKDGSGPVAYNDPYGDEDSCGVCCCDPSDADVCSSLGTGLNCQANKSPCSCTRQEIIDGTCDPDARGLCCGCAQDSDCSPDGVDPTDTGCGSDTCCRARPGVTGTTPEDESPNICRNTILAATFDQEMDLSSFSGSVILLGDYEGGACPEGTEYLAKDQKKLQPQGFFARLWQSVRDLAGSVLPSRIAQAYYYPSVDHTYCAVTGAANGRHIEGGSELVFQPSGLLDAGQRYYLIIRGDEDVADAEQTGVRSSWGIGMNGPHTETFNGITYANSYIISFRTLPPGAPAEGVCHMDDVTVEPEDFLFKTNENNLNDDNHLNNSFDTDTRDSDRLYTAHAWSRGREIQPIGEAYGWTWSWDRNPDNILEDAGIEGLENNSILLRVSPQVTDGRVEIRATANITAYEENPLGDTISGFTNAYVFVCDNPWPPPEDPYTGEWSPWRDAVQGSSCINNPCPNTNYELYYCRDAGGPGTYDDLPAIQSSGAVIRGTSDNSLKEAYFPREDLPGGTASLTVQNEGSGGTAVVRWENIAAGNSEINAYKLYIGRQSFAYNYDILVGQDGSVNLEEAGQGGLEADCLQAGGQMVCDIIGLRDETIYFFNVTSYNTGTGAEGDYYGEQSVTVRDAVGPPAPTGLSVTSSEGVVTLGWAEVAEAESYLVHYGTTDNIGEPDEDRVYGSVNDIGNETEVLIRGLVPGNTYYFAVQAVDEAGNPSLFSSEVAETVVD